MHIVFLCHEYPPIQSGGIGTFTQQLARRLVQQGHHATVVGLEKRPRASIEDDLGVRVHRLPQARLRPRFVGHALTLHRVLRSIHAERAIDVVEGAENAHALSFGRAPWLRSIRMNGGHRFFREAAGEPPAAWRSFLESRSFRRADHYYAVSRYIAERTRELLDLGDREIRVLPNPIDTEAFKPSGEPEVPGRVVFAGSLVEKKGIRQLVQAVPRIAEEVPEFHLVVCGRDTTENGISFRGRLEALLAPEHSHRVEFRGSVPHHELPGALANASVLAYPSHMEAMGIAWVEGMAMQKPVVAGNLGPAPELIEHGVSGLLCDPFDPDSIAHALVRLLRDAELRARLGKAARRRAVERFSLDSLAERTVDHYRAVLG